MLLVIPFPLSTWPVYNTELREEHPAQEGLVFCSRWLELYGQPLSVLVYEQSLFIGKSVQFSRNLWDAPKAIEQTFQRHKGQLSGWLPLEVNGSWVPDSHLWKSPPEWFGHQFGSLWPSWLIWRWKQGSFLEPTPPCRKHAPVPFFQICHVPICIPYGSASWLDREDELY